MLCYDKDYMMYKIDVQNMAQANLLTSADNLIDFTPYYSFTQGYDIWPQLNIFWEI